LLITLVASVIYVFGWMLYSNTMDPDFADRYFNQQAEQLRESGQSEESIQAQLADMENFKEMYKNPFMQLGFSFLEIFPVGLIITLICALLLKRKN